MDDDKVSKRIKDKRTKLQIKKELHERNAKERSDAIGLVRAAYMADKDSPILKDILEKAKKFSAYHTKIAQDAVGYKSNKAGEPPEVYRLTSEDRLQELDKAAGLLELVDYIERQLKDLPPQPKAEDDEPEDDAPEE